ncbi:Sec-independent protein translocase subunit TatA/TatB [Deinococcus peraridilitoris]|uniref:Sec-independent protein translocase protein TatA n=1 Tax=Deinococcus peraridilitoris (strain DSM 19664 / LMG 22246 / CIP 109416 / KR-200) TaxID=937777 RepID=K9ZZ55_DEIPD|nr:twin-arginine translocase TatA/TatE family subunit [Deinococcus peraridilitoris]AFZ66035.1 twin arginine-targeting protein translocase, TatA/E family [Deinococcus peraridilitoris DSM 19664]
MFGLGPAEIIVILLIALVVFGPKKLPEMGKSLGQGIREFRRSTSGIKEELESSFRDDPKSVASTEAPVTQTVIAPSDSVPEIEKRPQA